MWSVFLGLVLLTGCATRPPRLLAIGDSILAQHGARSVPAIASKRTGHTLTNAAIYGAWATPGGGIVSIPDQRVEGRWDWLILNGGANDLNGRCRCGDCTQVLDELITADTQGGVLVRLIEDAVARGTRVAFLGYADFPDGAEYGFDRCGDELAEHRRRVRALAHRMANVWFVDAREVITEAHFLPDRVHPTVQGSRLMGEQIADLIERVR